MKSKSMSNILQELLHAQQEKTEQILNREITNVLKKYGFNSVEDARAKGYNITLNFTNKLETNPLKYEIEISRIIETKNFEISLQFEKK